MVRLLLSVACICSCFISRAQIIEMGPDKLYKTLQSACQAATPGDTILIFSGTYNNGDYISNLKGTPNAWISIKAAPGQTVHFTGGTQAFQLSDPEYVIISGLNFSGQSGNGVNIDDAGTFDTPAKYIVFENCHWYKLNASGNSDQLKMSGVENFVIRNCTFNDGSAGGSMVDMVGCHDGLFENNVFTNGGSNCIQTKGGSSNITIIRNRFSDGGQRAINIGGSTDPQFFRPQGANTEASDIFIYSNIFEGANAALAFVGAVNCKAINNTIINPTSWAVRILQENTNAGMLLCSNNTIRNNIFVFSETGKPAFNIGSNTQPASFICSNNLWYNPDNLNWSGPNTPVAEPGIILNQDPVFDDSLYHISENSPAKGNGYPTGEPLEDFFNIAFKNPPSIGAAEYSIKTSTETAFHPRNVEIWPNPFTNKIYVKCYTSTSDRILILNIHGKVVAEVKAGEMAEIDASQWPVGIYFIQNGHFTQKIIKQ